MRHLACSVFAIVMFAPRLVSSGRVSPSRSCLSRSIQTERWKTERASFSAIFHGFAKLDALARGAG